MCDSVCVVGGGGGGKLYEGGAVLNQHLFDAPLQFTVLHKHSLDRMHSMWLWLVELKPSSDTESSIIYIHTYIYILYIIYTNHFTIVNHLITITPTISPYVMYTVLPTLTKKMHKENPETLTPNKFTLHKQPDFPAVSQMSVAWHCEPHKLCIL